MKEEICGNTYIVCNNDRYHSGHTWYKGFFRKQMSCPGVYPKRKYPKFFACDTLMIGYKHRLKLQPDKHTYNFVSWKCEVCGFEIEVFKHHVKSVLMYHNRYLDAFRVKSNV